MYSILDFLLTSFFRGDSFHPPALPRIVRRSGPPLGGLDDLPHSIDLASSVAAWHDWGAQQSQGRQGFDAELCQLLRQITKKEVVENFKCDLGDVEGLSASKSDLRRYATLRDFALAECHPWCNDHRPEVVRKNLLHHEVRITKSPPFNSDYFVTHAWDGRLFLANAGGSHHFATAWHIAKEINLAVPLQGRLYRYSLRRDVVNDLLRSVRLLAAPAELTENKLWRRALQKCDVLLAYILPPDPCRGSVILAFAARNPRSSAVAETLAMNGAEDLGTRLQFIANSRARW